MSEPVVVRERPGGVYTNDVMTSRHHFYADEPVDLGGSDIGPTPFEYLCGALGSCTVITMRMYARRKGWAVDHMEAKVSFKKIVSDEAPPRNVFTREITIEGDLEDSERTRLLEIAEKCPVHKVLEAGNEIVTKTA